MRREEQINRIARDCVHFRGNQPCQPHKRTGATCRCPAYCPQSGKALFIELSSRCAVIRSSAVLNRLKEDDPNIHITYLTAYPELLDSVVDEPLLFDAAAVLRIQMDQFDAAYNLDTDPRACAIMNVVSAEEKGGFYLRQGSCMPINDAAQSMYLRRIIPNSCPKNRPDEIQELFQLCSLEYRRERPRFGRSAGHNDKVKTHPTIALNTDADVWGNDNWTTLAKMLTKLCPTAPMLAGDAGEHAYASQKHATQSVIETISRCDIMVGVSDWKMELAWAMGKEIVLLQDNGHGTGADVSYFGTRCYTARPTTELSETDSIRNISPDQVFEAIKGCLNQKTTCLVDVATQNTSKINRPQTNKHSY